MASRRAEVSQRRPSINHLLDNPAVELGQDAMANVFDGGGPHWPSQCPDRGDRKTDATTDKPGKCAMAFCMVSFVAAGGVEDGGDTDDEDT